MRRAAIFFAASAAACGSEAMQTQVKVRDVRVAIPTPEAGIIDLVSPEVEIPSGEDRMFCYYLDSTDEMVVSGLEAKQGLGGHHIVLLTTKAPRPPGTFEDCTDPANMVNFRSLVLPDTPLPEGHAVRVPQNTQFVFQIHYVNTFEEAILVRDVARLKTVDPSTVRHWVSTFTTNSLSINLPEGPSEQSFDCTLDKDVDLLLLGGHMHEQGKTFEITIGDGTTMESFYYVDPWKDEFRDAPPVELFLENPHRLSAGTVLRTHCKWDNTLGRQLPFPDEMCSSFGYLRGLEEPVHCELVDP